MKQKGVNWYYNIIILDSEKGMVVRDSVNMNQVLMGSECK